jgi:hypothetical protein
MYVPMRGFSSPYNMKHELPIKGIVDTKIPNKEKDTEAHLSYDLEDLRFPSGGKNTG